MVNTVTTSAKPAKAAAALPASSSLDRMLSVLDVFTAAAPVWSIEGLMRYSGTTRSTCYRYIRSLVKAGLLTPVESGAYTLGPRVLELDRLIRLNDPLYTAGLPVLRELTRDVGYTGLLCMLYSNSVMCIHQERVDSAPAGLFSRGERRPLFLAAASKVILAHLPPHQLRSLFAKHRSAIAAAGLGADWEQFKTRLKAMRDAGYCRTTGEFQVGITGISVPIFNRSNHVLGSIGIAEAAHLVPASSVPALAARLSEAGQAITARIRSIDQLMDLSARAVGSHGSDGGSRDSGMRERR